MFHKTSNDKYIRLSSIDLIEKDRTLSDDKKWRHIIVFNNSTWQYFDSEEERDTVFDSLIDILYKSG